MLCDWLSVTFQLYARFDWPYLHKVSICVDRELRTSDLQRWYVCCNWQKHAIPFQLDFNDWHTEEDLFQFRTLLMFKVYWSADDSGDSDEFYWAPLHVKTVPAPTTVYYLTKITQKQRWPPLFTVTVKNVTQWLRDKEEINLKTCSIHWEMFTGKAHFVWSFTEHDIIWQTAFTCVMYYR